MKRPLTIRTPRQLLVVLGVILFAIGVQTYRYPPAFSDLWCALAILASMVPSGWTSISQLLA